MQQDDRLRMWIEQGNVTIPQLFFSSYKQLGIRDTDAMLILQMEAYRTQTIEFPTPADFASRMHLSENEVSQVMQRLMQKGYLKIDQGSDEDGVLFERFSLMPLWEAVASFETERRQDKAAAGGKEEEGQIFGIFEQEFGRLLSPMECETIAMWIDQDYHSPEIIRAALKEAVIAQKLSMRYIDRILFEWKKKNVTTLADVEKQTQAFRTPVQAGQAVRRQETKKRVPLYNWLEDRDG
ncbi:DNA replication protein DnaD [Sporosarcina sp. NCCP-2716]|uniref:DnaD domain-containing protein n=1 Tax=Sporosarcina sp. NCCP-2716 TaxID=2943679 RepID=UPI0020405E70|nr:DnaD domain-containing protein [Sporosarcina sp. NCCP-2716]GKV67977.1 DNA replication protein DnaD [Sporosarcina sp. NCCP-2716]